MLSYQHLYHAGNFADVHKHAILVLLLQALQQKPAPFCYMETHAGRAGYDLTAAEAQKNHEYVEGIQRLLTNPAPHDGIAAYRQLVQQYNPDPAAMKFYPGSPLLAQHFLRQTDVMLLAEMHPAEAPLLRETFRDDKRVAVHQRDGFEMLRALVPPVQKRGLVLLDPSYELAEDYTAVIDAMQLLHKRWRSAMVMVWYPILNRSQHQHFIERVAQTVLRDVLCCELQITAYEAPVGMKGSGVLIMNPPWQCDLRLQALMPCLASTLATSGSTPTWRVEQLLAE